MIINNAAKRHENPRESDFGRKSSNVRHTPIVELSPRLTKQHGQSPLDSNSSWNLGSGNSARNQNLAAGTGLTGSGSGWSLLAPLTVGFIVEAIARTPARKNRSNHPEVIRQLDQYRSRSRRDEQQVKIDTPEILEPEIDEDTTDKADKNDRLNLNGLRTLRGTGKKVALPQRKFVPGPVREGRVFKEVEVSEEPHKPTKSGWIKLRNHRN